MASIKPTNILDFNYGIAAINDAQTGAADSNLPDFLPLRPSEQGVENRLLKIFKDRSFTAQMMAQYEPAHAPREYLIPFLFREELKKAFKELVDNEEHHSGGRQQQQQEEDEQQGQQRQHRFDPKRKKKLKKASKLLKDTEEAWLLLDMYQRSLLRG